jgi:hypothetical protein
MSIASSSTGISTGSLLNLSSTGAISNASGSLLNINSAAANTSGYLATITGNATATGSILNLSGTALTTGSVINATAGTTTGNAVNITANGVAAGNGINLTANGLTSGNAINVTSTSANGTPGTDDALINLIRSGANAGASHVAYGVYSAVSNTGTTNTNIAGYFSASGASTANYAVQGTTATNIGIGVYGSNTAASGSSTGTGVYGTTLQSGGYGVEGENTATSGSSIGVYGTVSYAGLAGVDHPGAIEGISSAASGTQNAAGVIGKTNQSNGPGVVGINLYTSAGGIGVLGSQEANAASPVVVFPTGGAGGSFTGNGTSGTGKVIIGVAGYANSGTTTATGSSSTSFYAGGYFGSGINTGTLNPNYYAYVGAISNGTNYKILGTGTVSTIVRNKENKKVTMYCPEATEILLEDYGTATLTNGKVHIDLDPTYAKNIAVNEKHALRVMITLNDQCNGVYVTNRTKTGFDVVELNNGTSNAAFTYNIVANRADEYDVDGTTLLSKNQDLRFSDAPDAEPNSSYSTGNNNTASSVLPKNNSLNKPE